MDLRRTDNAKEEVREFRPVEGPGAAVKLRGKVDGRGTRGDSAAAVAGSV